MATSYRTISKLGQVARKRGAWDVESAACTDILTGCARPRSFVGFCRTLPPTFAGVTAELLAQAYEDYCEMFYATQALRTLGRMGDK